MTNEKTPGTIEVAWGIIATKKAVKTGSGQRKNQ
jgi:hypothetical protein